MKYIVFDLEFNQYNPYKDSQPSSNSPYEIIQIGAIKLDKNLNIVSLFDRFIKPEVYSEMHPFVRQLTGITTEQLMSEKSFKLVYEDFIKFIDNDESIFCIWGMVDIKELFKTTHYYRLSSSLLPTEYIDLQSYASKYFKCPKGTKIGLRHSIELLNIPIEKQFHNALHDALYTVEVFRKLFNEQMRPKTYDFNLSNVKRVHQKRKKLDNDKLIQQFEKMYNRKMTEEEKDIIKLAYLMGKTNQFQI